MSAYEYWNIHFVNAKTFIAWDGWMWETAFFSVSQMKCNHNNNNHTATSYYICTATNKTSKPKPNQMLAENYISQRHELVMISHAYTLTNWNGCVSVAEVGWVWSCAQIPRRALEILWTSILLLVAFELIHIRLINRKYVKPILSWPMPIPLFQSIEMCIYWTK